jgi:hypothetical protein
VLVNLINNALTRPKWPDSADRHALPMNLAERMDMATASPERLPRIFGPLLHHPAGPGRPAGLNIVPPNLVTGCSAVGGSG